MSLYVKVQKLPKETIVSFLIRCFKQRTLEDMVYIDGFFCSTYLDNEYITLQNKPARRSAEIYYEVVKTYYPWCSKEHFFKQLRKLFEIEITLTGKYNAQNKTLGTFFCPDIQKWVMHFAWSERQNFQGNLYLANMLDSYKKLNVKGKGEYTYLEIMSNMGY